MIVIETPRGARGQNIMTGTNTSDVRERARSMRRSRPGVLRYQGQFSGRMRFIRQWEGWGMNGDSGGRLAAGVERDLDEDMQV